MNFELSEEISSSSENFLQNFFQGSGQVRLDLSIHPKNLDPSTFFFTHNFAKNPELSGEISRSPVRRHGENPLKSVEGDPQRL